MFEFEFEHLLLTAYLSVVYSVSQNMAHYMTVTVVSCTQCCLCIIHDFSIIVRDPFIVLL